MYQIGQVLKGRTGIHVVVIDFREPYTYDVVAFECTDPYHAPYSVVRDWRIMQLSRGDYGPARLDRMTPLSQTDSDAFYISLGSPLLSKLASIATSILPPKKYTQLEDIIISAKRHIFRVPGTPHPFSPKPSDDLSASRPRDIQDALNKSSWDSTVIHDGCYTLSEEETRRVLESLVSNTAKHSARLYHVMFGHLPPEHDEFMPHPRRISPIDSEDVLNLRIDLGLCKDSKEFIDSIQPVGK